jgi:hypothetical protein
VSSNHQDGRRYSPEIPYGAVAEEVRDLVVFVL